MGSVGDRAPREPRQPRLRRPRLRSGRFSKSGRRRTQDVRYLQKLLGITVDGVFGSETEEAVKKAQKENGLPADGIVGPYTWAALMK